MLQLVYNTTNGQKLLCGQQKRVHGDVAICRDGTGDGSMKRLEDFTVILQLVEMVVVMVVMMAA